NSVDIRGLTRRDVFSTAVNGEIQFTPKTAGGAGVSYVHENYKRTGFADSDDLTIPIDFYYKYTPKVDLSLGYRYRDYQVSIGDNSVDHFINVGARGEFTPKLVGKIQVGLNTRQLNSGGSENQLGVDASATYELT